jgi:thioredoxin 1
MSAPDPYLGELQSPTRETVDALPGLTLLEFGTGWCGHCQAAQSAIAEWLGQQVLLRHLKIEDGPGRALGRSFRVKLWPTLILLREGRELARVVRPLTATQIGETLGPFSHA